jgi:hypothetical protein
MQQRVVNEVLNIGAGEKVLEGVGVVAVVVVVSKNNNIIYKKNKTK